MAIADSQGPARRTPSSPRGTGRLVVRVTVATLSVLTLLGGAGLVAVCALLLAELERNPPQPPGQIVALLPMAGAAVGAVLGLIGVAGLTLVALTRQRPGRRRDAG